MKRALIFIFSFIGVAVVIYAMAIVPNYSAFKTLFTNAEGMAEGSEYVANTYSLADLTNFIGKKPEHVSLVSLSLDEPDSSLYYEAQTPRTMGSLGNLILLYAYTQAVAQERINPDALLSLDEISRFELPMISQNAHSGAIEALTLDKSTFTLDEVVSKMVQFNDLVLADFLWYTLGEETIRSAHKELVDQLGLQTTELPLPNIALYTAVAWASNASLEQIPTVFGPDSVQLMLGDPELNNLRTQKNKRVRWQNSVLNHAADLYSNPDKVASFQAFFQDNRLNLSFMEERDVLVWFPQTTAQELASILNYFIQDESVPSQLRTHLLELMGWPNGSSTIERSFNYYYAQYDSRMGLLSGVDYGSSLYTGEQRIQVIIFDQLPIAFWHHMSANHMQEDYQQRLIWDPALYQTTKSKL